MTLDLTKPVQTRDGRPAQIIWTNRNVLQPVVALVGKNEKPYTFHRSGRWLTDDDTPHDCDLINVPVKHEGWINIIQHGNLISEIYASEFEANEAATHYVKGARVACVRVEWEEP